MKNSAADVGAIILETLITREDAVRTLVGVNANRSTGTDGIHPDRRTRGAGCVQLCANRTVPL